MNPEIEEQVKAELKKLSDYFFWKIRDLAGEFPYKIRVDTFFSRNEGKNSHFIEVETSIDKQAIEIYEESYQEWQKKDAVQAAADFLKKGGE